MRLCVEAQDILAGDDVVNRGIVSRAETVGDTTTLTMRSSAERVALWSGDHVWVDRTVAA